MAIREAVMAAALAIVASACASTPHAQAPDTSTPFAVAVQWGGEQAPWHREGVWRIGDRPSQGLTQVQATRLGDSNDLFGVANYAGEGPIGFRAHWLSDNAYEVEYQWGGERQPWNPGGIWRIGGRQNQPIAAVDITSPDGGATLVGQVQYVGEGPIGFRGKAQR